MSPLDEFFSNEENKKKYGFEYTKNEYGGHSIIYDGDVNRLMEIAYEAAGYRTVQLDELKTDNRPLLTIGLAPDGNLINQENGTPIAAGVDGVGDEPNFYLRFLGEEEIELRFSMVDPKLLPDDDSCPYRFSMSSLSAINAFYEAHHRHFIACWNQLRPDMPLAGSLLPNYRAINRLRSREH